MIIEQYADSVVCVYSSGDCLPTLYGYMQLTSDDKALMYASYGQEKGSTTTKPLRTKYLQ